MACKVDQTGLIHLFGAAGRGEPERRPAPAVRHCLYVLPLLPSSALSVVLLLPFLSKDNAFPPGLVCSRWRGTAFSAVLPLPCRL